MAAMPMIFGSTLTLPTFFFLLRVYMLPLWVSISLALGLRLGLGLWLGLRLGLGFIF